MGPKKRWKAGTARRKPGGCREERRSRGLPAAMRGKARSRLAEAVFIAWGRCKEVCCGS